MNTTSPSPVAPPEPASRPWFKKKRLIIPAAVGVLLVVGAIAGGSDDESTDVPADASAAVADDTIATETEPNEPGTAATEAEETNTTTETPVAERGTREAPLALGESARVGDYDVTIVGFTADATAQVLDANMFNDQPATGEVYALVRVRATYDGEGEGWPGMDLSVGYIGDDGRVYVDHDCFAVEPDGLMDQPQLVAGGTAEGNLALCLPASVLGTGSIFVEPLFSFDDDKTWWSES